MSQFNIKPRSIIETSNVHAIKHLVLCGMGITFLTRLPLKKSFGKKDLSS
mgnify:FL=1